MDYTFEEHRWWIEVVHKAYGELPANHTLTSAGQIEIFETEEAWRTRLNELEIDA